MLLYLKFITYKKMNYMQSPAHLIIVKKRPRHETQPACDR